MSSQHLNNPMHMTHQFNHKLPKIGRAHVWTPVTLISRMPSSAWKKKKKKETKTNKKKQKNKNQKKKKKNIGNGHNTKWLQPTHNISTG